MAYSHHSYVFQKICARVLTGATIVLAHGYGRYVRVLLQLCSVVLNLPYIPVSASQRAQHILLRRASKKPRRRRVCARVCVYVYPLVHVCVLCAAFVGAKNNVPPVNLRFYPK